MSADYYARTYLGFEVAEKELWIPEEEALKMCPRHHKTPAVMEGDFCPFCGNRLRVLQDNKMSPAIKILYERCREDEDEGDFWEDLCNDGVGAEHILFHHLDAVQDSEPDPFPDEGLTGIAILLREVGENNPYDEATAPVTMATMQRLVMMFQELSIAMFGEEREVKLYPTFYCSV